METVFTLEAIKYVFDALNMRFKTEGYPDEALCDELSAIMNKLDNRHKTAAI